MLKEPEKQIDLLPVHPEERDATDGQILIDRGGDVYLSSEIREQIEPPVVDPVQHQIEHPYGG
ncbi:MAG: hypothetical protein PVJ52_00730 [Candidatus Woesebacteria bacterium]|jgi:hypothetical protein